MTIEEIFNKLASHMWEGLLYHDEMGQAYDFFGLRGYAMCQIYHYIEESHGYKQLINYYSKHYYKLLQVENINRPKIIPENWYKYTTMAVDAGTKRKAIKELIEHWINWEKQTKKLYQEMQAELYNIKEFAAALFLDKYIEDVSKELHHAETKLIYLEGMDYDMSVIIDHQQALYKKYKKKLRW